MSKRMLIDGTHPEEIRVVVSAGKRLDEYDVETSTKKQLKGNIYLAKVTRVEPSLQAAFVDYGGNRHGFLAFNEIHPDYYQIPVADREALLREQAELDMNAMAAHAHVDEMDGEVSDTAEPEDDGAIEEAGGHLDDEGAEAAHDGDLGEAASTEGASEPSDMYLEGTEAESGDVEDQADADQDGDDRAVAERRRQRNMRRYKIQEVIKRRQILLVQVVKEERGNKGAALTTYISLAGRYCVLMPNTGRGGGISRKITSATSRRKLRDILAQLEIPQGMGVIMRTAGMERSKSEIKRDFEYLLRAWDNIRELTLESTAPTLIYEEGNLIKRAIRDLYNKDIDEILIEGNDAYQTAKKFMRMLMPSHAKRVQPYRDEEIPLFHRYQVESQLDAMLDPVVQLKSGGYIVIHTTEALVAIDVNSGRSTRERNIEETALKTNVEAAEEVARQLRLRDLAGLVVIDFIDMEVPRNLRKVERVLKDAMAVDRARIQIGRISTFGLLELSRQRLRPSLQETSTEVCPHCEGVGYVRSTESMAVRVLRALEEEGIRRRSSEITVRVPIQVALYVLNRKRAVLTEIENRYGFSVSVEGDNTLPASEFELDRVKARAPQETEEREVINMEAVARAAEAEEAESRGEEAPQKRSRRRRRKEDAEVAVEVEAAPEEAPGPMDEDEKASARRRRRGRRGGRRRARRSGGEATPHEDAINATFAWARRDEEARRAAEAGDAETKDEEQPESDRKRAQGSEERGGRSRRRRRPRTESAAPQASVDAHQAAIEETFAWAANGASAPVEPVGDIAVAVHETEPVAKSEDIEPAVEMEPAAESEAAEPAVETEQPEKTVEPNGNGAGIELPAETPAVATEAGTPEEESGAPEEKAPEAVVIVGAEPAEPAPAKPKKRGWWQRITE